MACNINDGISRPACPGETPGAYDTIYLFNRDEVTAFTAGAGDIVQDVAFSAGEGYYQVVGKKNSVVARAEKQDNDTDATDYTHEIDIQLTDLSTTARDFVNSLNGANLGAIVRTKGDKFLFYGYNDGIQMKVNTMSTAADALGYFITLRETQVSELPRIFYQTSPTVTLSNITSKVVGS